MKKELRTFQFNLAAQRTYLNTGPVKNNNEQTIFLAGWLKRAYA